MSKLTELLRQLNEGRPEAQDELFEAAYSELRILARARLRDGGRGTCLDTTALVHESYLRALRSGRLHSSNRREFFAYASKVMRSVIVDTVRERHAQCRGHQHEHVTLGNTAAGEISDGSWEILHVHEALQDLEKIEPRLAQVVEMRYFGGYTDVEIAETLAVTDRTVRRDWERARLLLTAALGAC